MVQNCNSSYIWLAIWQEEHLKPETSLDEGLVESAKSSLLFELIEKEENINGLITLSVLSMFQNQDVFYNRRLVKKVMHVEMADLLRVGMKYLLPLFDPTIVRTAVICHPSKCHELQAAFGRLDGYKSENEKVAEDKCPDASELAAMAPIEQATLRPIVYYEFLQGHSARAAADNICAAFKGNVVHYSTVSRWLKRLESGDTTFGDRPRSGRPSTRLDIPRESIDEEEYSPAEDGLRGVRVSCVGPLRKSKDDLDMGVILENLPAETIQLDVFNFLQPVIKPGMFSALPQLRRLNLSGNGIEEIKSGALQSLQLLRKLDLSGNHIRSLSHDVFQGLSTLSKIDLANNTLKHLENGTFNGLQFPVRVNLALNQMMCDCNLEWLLQGDFVRLTPTSLCYSPPNLRNYPIKKLTSKDLLCDWNLPLPKMKISPSQPQFLFKGDSFEFQCQAEEINTHGSPDSLGSIRVAWIWKGLEVISNPHDGTSVTFKYDDEGFSHSSTLYINRVQDEHAGVWQCLMMTDRGNHSAALEILVMSESTKFCPQSGFPWLAVPAGSSDFWNNLTLSVASAYDSAIHLLNYTQDGGALQDKIDVVFIAQTLEKYLRYIPGNLESHKDLVWKLAKQLVDIAAVVQKLPQELIYEAQKEDGAAARILQALIRILSLLPDTYFSSSSLSLASVSMRLDSFTGLLCLLVHSDEFSEANLRCYLEPFVSSQSGSGNLSLLTVPLSSLYMQVETSASLRIPGSAFGHLKDLGFLQSALQHVRIFAFTSGHLFPLNFMEQTFLTSILGCHLGTLFSSNLTDPIVIEWKSDIGKNLPSQSLHPVVWNMVTNVWDPADSICTVEKSHSSISLHCNKCGFYAIITVKEELDAIVEMARGPGFRLFHPLVYVGTAVAVTCLLAAAIIHGVYAIHLSIGRNLRHILINLWITIALLLLVFRVLKKSAREEEEREPVVKTEPPVSHPCSLHPEDMGEASTELGADDDDDEEPGVIIVKPISRFYLCGWGVPLIVVGISGAVHFKDYASPLYCFLQWPQSAWAVLLPISILLFLTFIYFLSARLTIHKIEETSARSSWWRLLVLALLFVFTWMAAALLVIASDQSFLPFVDSSTQEMIFTVIYCLMSNGLGLFVLFFYCLLSTEVRAATVKRSFSPSRLSLHEENANVEKVVSQPSKPPSLCSQSQPGIQLCSGSVHSNQMHSTEEGGGGSKCNGSSVIPQDLLMGTEVIPQPRFYDPHQSIIAKKFFQRQRRKKHRGQLHSYRSDLNTTTDDKSSDHFTSVSAQAASNHPPPMLRWSEDERGSDFIRPDRKQEEPFYVNQPARELQPLLHSMSSIPDSTYDRVIVGQEDDGRPPRPQVKAGMNDSLVMRTKSLPQAAWAQDPCIYESFSDEKDSEDGLSSHRYRIRKTLQASDGSDFSLNRRSRNRSRSRSHRRSQEKVYPHENKQGMSGSVGTALDHPKAHRRRRRKEHSRDFSQKRETCV
ncbi:unnamed protein product [Darwinula stevensoni]|uniref:Uncharacterized protein n=1 Tax=Darwinula stevensoni TaxID=69355 RepID=A0A7R8X7C4_9CRUS|nr:unnamed protein product [Darwinula stevensoni]CAG0882172.1 unnamed protein product [Darwinula stevensoni]